MKQELHPLPKCICCGAAVHIPPKAVSLRCPFCRSEMSIPRFSLEEQALSDQLNALRAQLDQTCTDSEALRARLDSLLAAQHTSQSARLERLYRLGEEAQRAGRFDEAIRHYQNLIVRIPQPESEIHWRIMLCRYGIEYVREQSSGCALPTITRMDTRSILQDEDYLSACALAPDEQIRSFYIREGEHIDRLLCKYQHIHALEAPYDVFISVKQGTADGAPTSDSQTALRLYAMLEELGLKVFNSRVSLGQCAGSEYEPLIMHALSTARTMIVTASCEEFMYAPWVRNEWRRFRWLQQNVNPDLRLIAYITSENLWNMQELGGLQLLHAARLADPIRELRSVVLRNARPASEVPAPEDEAELTGDPMLTAALCQELNRTSLTPSALRTITRLSAVNLGIRDISLLKYCSALTELDLSGNEISDLRPLASLFALERLSLNDNSVRNLQPLFALRRLTHLSLDGNRGAELGPLEQLPALQRLSLRNLSLSDLSPLTGLTGLKTLFLSGNPLTDVSPLAALTGLKKLVLTAPDERTPLRLSGYAAIAALTERGCRIHDRCVRYRDNPLHQEIPVPDAALEQALRAALRKKNSGPLLLEDMHALTELDLSQAVVQDIRVLECCIHLIRLVLTASSVRRLTGWNTVTALRERGCQVEDISVLYNDNPLHQEVSFRSDSLKYAVCHQLKKSSLEPILVQDMHRLTELEFCDSFVYDLTPLSCCIRLERLHLSGFPITRLRLHDLSPLCALPSLTVLRLTCSEISDLSCLSRLNRLTVLDLTGTSVSDPAFLRKLTSLEELSLQNTGIADITPLHGLSSLRRLNLRENPQLRTGWAARASLQSAGCLIEEDAAQFDDAPVSSADEALLWALRTVLNLSAGQPVRKNELAALTELRLPDKNITCIDILKYCSSLEKLDLSGNPISSLSPLRDLTTLKELNLSGCALTCLTPSQLPASLIRLEFRRNKLLTLPSVQRLSALQLLDISENPQLHTGYAEAARLAKSGCIVRTDGIIFTDDPCELTIGDPALEELLRRRLNLPAGPITCADLQKITDLRDHYSKIERIDALKYCLRLTHLTLCSPHIRDISPLKGLASLTHLTLGSCPVEDISPIASLTALKQLSLKDLPVRDISPLGGLSGLCGLTIAACPVKDLSVLTTLPALTELEIRSCPAEDLSPVFALRNLKRLFLTGLKILDLSPLSAMGNLLALSLDGNGISDISPLGCLTQLKDLSLSYNSISDLSALSSLTQLENLTLSGNRIRSLRPLAAHRALRFVALSRNPIRGKHMLRLLLLPNENSRVIWHLKLHGCRVLR